MWGVSERSVRNYCALGRVPGAVLEGKAWLIPSGAEKPAREKRHSTKSLKNETVLARLLREKESGLKGSLYHRVQIDLTYNSNHIEGSRLTHDQTRYIFETKTLGITDSAVKVDDIVETVNHFRCVDLVIQNAGRRLTESFIKQLHPCIVNHCQLKLDAVYHILVINLPVCKYCIRHNLTCLFLALKSKNLTLTFIQKHFSKADCHDF